MIDRRTFLGAAMTTVTTGVSGQVSPLTRFFVPAEEARHARTWMCWASTKSIYGRPASYFESLQEALGRLAAAIVEHEPVTMLAAAKDHDLVRRFCGPKVELLDIATDDMWARDSGPVFLNAENGERAVLDLNFNGWGGKQRSENDSRVATAIADHLGRHRIQAEIVGEGGGVEYDGDGTLILTESCWVNENRNPGLSRDDIETRIKTYFGVEKVIWLPGVRGRDITDGHIDGFVRIIRPGVLMMGGWPGDTTSVWGRDYMNSREILGRARDARGRAFEIVEIPSATNPRSREADLFTSYANFYVGNGAVYTPNFGDDRADSLAIERLGQLFPDRKIVALEVDRIYENGGGIHCVTQQEPV